MLDLLDGVATLLKHHPSTKAAEVSIHFDSAQFDSAH
jgi:hypothetical protein